jgi:hypothetical protein
MELEPQQIEEMNNNQGTIPDTTPNIFQTPTLSFQSVTNPSAFKNTSNTHKQLTIHRIPARRTFYPKPRRTSIRGNLNRIKKHTYQHKKRHILTSPLSIQKILTYQCCKKNCISSQFTHQQILEQRNIYSKLNEQERTTYIVDIMNSCYTCINPPKFIYRIATHTVCSTALLKIIGFSKNKYTSALQVFTSRGRIHIHGNAGRRTYTIATANAHCWLDTFFTAVGDLMPNGEIHLPIIVTWKELHGQMLQQLPDQPCLGYCAFRLHIKNHYQHVKLPRKTMLGRCITCISLTQQRFRSLSIEEANQFVIQRNNHLALISAERLSYHSRRNKAITFPSLFLSLIIDYSNPISLPRHFPRPKHRAVNGGSLFSMSIGGVIRHGHGRHLYLHPNFSFPKDPNLVLTLLWLQLRDVFSSNTHRPSTLYLQADNCYSENKNTYMLAFLSLLVKMQLVQNIYLHFLPVGHTHEDIDQLFSTLQNDAKRRSLHTVESLHDLITSSYLSDADTMPHIHELTTVWDFKSWLAPHMQGLRYHSEPHAFHIYYTPTNEGSASIRDQAYATTGSWSNPYCILTSSPNSVPYILHNQAPPTEVIEATNEFLQLQDIFDQAQRQSWDEYFIKLQESSQALVVEDVSFFDNICTHPQLTVAEDTVLSRLQTRVQVVSTRSPTYNFHSLTPGIFVVIKTPREHTYDESQVFWVGQVSQVTRTGARVKRWTRQANSSWKETGIIIRVQFSSIILANINFNPQTGLTQEILTKIYRYL